MFEFIETPFITKALERYLDDDEYCELQAYLNEHPDFGRSFLDPVVYASFAGPSKGVGNVAGYVSSIMCASFVAKYGGSRSMARTFAKIYGRIY